MSANEKKITEAFENYQKLLYGESFKCINGTKETSIPREKVIPVYDNDKLIGYYLL